METQRTTGETVEGMSFEYTYFYEDNENTPFACEGFYYSKDGRNFAGDKFLPTYFCYDTTNEKTNEFLPWVIYEGLMVNECNIEPLRQVEDSKRPNEFYENRVIGYLD